VEMAVGVWQCGGDKKLTGHGAGHLNGQGVDFRVRHTIAL
jgi:hypothetical protein